MICHGWRRENASLDDNHAVGERLSVSGQQGRRLVMMVTSSQALNITHRPPNCHKEPLRNSQRPSTGKPTLISPELRMHPDGLDLEILKEAAQGGNMELSHNLELFPSHNENVKGGLGKPKPAPSTQSSCGTEPTWSSAIPSPVGTAASSRLRICAPMSCRRGPRLLHIAEEARKAFECLICKGTVDGHVVVGRCGDRGCGARDRCESALVLGGANCLMVLFGWVFAHARLLRFILLVCSGGLFVDDCNCDEQRVCNTRKIDAR
jgi:hypothetical protein